MTVERAIYYQKYTGLSGDDKPMPSDDFPLSLMVGAEFVETDTCNTYVWNGSDWVIKPAVGIKIWDEGSTSFKGLQFNAESPQVCAQS